MQPVGGLQARLQALAANGGKQRLTSGRGTGKILSIPPILMTNPCKHPQVRVVAREDDVEFVECQSCREVFDAAEYVDMAIEEEEDLTGQAAGVNTRPIRGRR